MFCCAKMVEQFYIAFFSYLFRFSRAMVFAFKKLDQKRNAFCDALNALFSPNLDTINDYLVDFESRWRVKEDTT